MQIAGVQMDIKIGKPERNLDEMIERLATARHEGSHLVIFPECAATGYCFESLEEAREYAQPIPGPNTEKMTAACKQQGCFAVFGMLEADGDRVFNAAVLVGPQGVVGSYRKVHLPFLGVDEFVSFGDRPFAVHDAEKVRVGMNICYDASFPEGARDLTLQGADLIALPTNWPPGAELVAAHTINARAMENGVYFAAVNRIGHERGFDFIGMSRICAPSGETLAEADHRDEAILYAEIDPAVARNKRVVRVPGKHAIDRLADRRPEMYGRLVEPHNLPRPGRK